jgi:hypothetical protein
MHRETSREKLEHCHTSRLRMSRKDGPRSDASDTDGSTDTQLGRMRTSDTALPPSHNRA